MAPGPTPRAEKHQAWRSPASCPDRRSLQEAVPREPDLTPELVRQLSFGAWADVSKAVEELGYQVVPLKAMVKEAVDWMRAEELIPAHSH